MENFIGRTAEEIKEFTKWNNRQRKVTKRIVLSDSQKEKMRIYTKEYLKRLQTSDPLEYKAQWKYKNLLRKFKDDDEGLKLELEVYQKVIQKMRKHFIKRGLNLDA